MAIEPISAPSDTFADELKALLRNWHEELSAYFHETWPNLLGVSQQLVMDVSGDEFVLSSVSGEGVQEHGRFHRDSESTEAAILVLAQTGHLVRGRADVVIRFASPLVLRPGLRLPKASPRTLRGALGYELERLSPVTPSELYFDSVVTSYDKPTHRVSLSVRAMRRSDVDATLHLCHAMGLSVSSITFDGDREAADWRAFPVDRVAVARSLWRHWGAGVLGVHALLLIVAIAFAGASRMSEANDALNTAVATESIRAEQVERLLHKMETTRGQASYVTQRRNAPLLVESLANLSDALPNGTWIDEVSISGTKLRLQGYSHSGAELIGRLDRSVHFANAQFGAPLVRSANDGTERFDLSADIKGVP